MMFDDHTSRFSLFVFLLWSTWDTMPMMFMIRIHYQNFSSFKDEKLEAKRYLDNSFSLDLSDDDEDESDMRTTMNPLFSNHQLLETNSILNIESQFEESDEDDEGAAKSKKKPKKLSPKNLLPKSDSGVSQS